ncbi:site-2 protease family protein [bacterium]|nr:site-2 protease family protein [bacterium]
MRLRTTPAGGVAANPALLFVASLALFVMSVGRDATTSVAALVAVIFLHETGHYLGMRAFGYRNVRMFFIPFFGGGASGMKETAPAWQEAVVLLLGPVPGLVVGLVLAASGAAHQEPWVYDLAFTLVVLNAFNLLPLFPLDGGRLFEVLLLARRPAATAVFRLLAVAGLGLIAWDAGSWVLGVLAGLMLLGTPLASSQAGAAVGFRAAYPDAADTPEGLRDDQLADLVRRAQYQGQTKPRPLAQLAMWVRDVHAQATTDRAAGSTVAFFVGIYLIAWVTALAGVVNLVVLPAGPDEGEPPAVRAE